MSDLIRLRKEWDPVRCVETYTVYVNVRAVGTITKWESYIWDISGWHVDPMTSSFKRRKDAVDAMVKSYKKAKYGQ